MQVDSAEVRRRAGERGAMVGNCGSGLCTEVKIFWRAVGAALRWCSRWRGRFSRDGEVAVQRYVGSKSFDFEDLSQESGQFVSGQIVVAPRKNRNYTR